MYPPEIFGGVWDKLDELARSRRLQVPQEVHQELKAQDDDLYKWLTEREPVIVAATSRAVMLEARDVLKDHPELTKTGIGRNKADPFVIALACLNGCTVVTEEQGGTARRPRIPYICDHRSVKHVS